MDFTFSEEQLLAAQTLRELLADHCRGSDLRRAAVATGAAAFREACGERGRRLAELGLAGALVPAEVGGLDLEAIDLLLLAEEVGRAALPEPLVASAAIAHPLLAVLARQGGEAGPVLAAALAGETVALALPPGVSTVAGAPLADWFVVARAADEVALFGAPAVGVSACESIDPLRRLGVLDTIGATPVAVLSGPDVQQAWMRAQSINTVLDAAQLLGLAARMIELAVTYALERKQFGKAIAGNQAVKHQLADVMVKLEFARPVVYAAATTLAPLRVSHALVAAGDAADRAARTAIQVHGAMGYSWEVDLQFYAKRAWALAGLNGGRSRHFAHVHAALRDGGVAIGPDQLFNESAQPSGAVPGGCGG